MNYHAKTLPFVSAIRSFDRMLQRTGDLTLDKAERALQELEQFHVAARMQDSETEYYIAAGCRISQDLNDAVLGSLIETVQTQEQHIQALSLQLQQALAERQRASTLLKKAQHIRNDSLLTSEATGLGVIL